MRFDLRRGMAAAAAAALITMTAVSTAHAEEASPETAPADTLVDRIAAAAGEGADTPELLSEQLGLPVAGAGSLSFDAEQRIVATVMFGEQPDAALLASVGELAEVDSVFERFAAATVRVDPGRLGELAELPGVLAAYPELDPIVGSQRAAAPAVLPAANRADGTACGPIPVEADSPLRSDQARELFGIDGSGVTVGIISDSFDLLDDPTSWADDVASGALPGPGNPCGRTIPVEVLHDHPYGGGDEGRAMAQLVHGIAPGAKLLFASTGVSELEMAARVDELVAAGADVIVDDISWSSELSYQQGFLSQAINLAREAGVAYFTSAGNANAVGSRGASTGLPIGSWQTTAYRPMACPAWVLDGPEDPLTGTEYDCLDFDPTADDGVQTPYDTLSMLGAADGTTVPLMAVGSVGEPIFGATTDYEWRFYEVDAVSGEPRMIGPGLPRFSPLHPNFAGVVDLPSGGEIRMVMVRKGHDPGARLPAVYTFFMRGGSAIAERAHLGDGVRDWVGEAPFGHGADGSAVAIASLAWDEPDTVREYSSLGPATLLFEPVILPPVAEPAARLDAPLLVDTPRLAAVDGTQTTFFGQDEGDEQPEYRFYGTSAAAPNAAAVAALALSYAPDIEEASLTQLMIDTADDGVVNPYAPRFEDAHVFGAGRIDALALLSALPERPAVGSFALDRATPTELHLDWAAGSADHFVIELYLGEIAPEHALEAEQLPAGASAHAFTGLDPDTAYTVRLTPYGSLGVEGVASVLQLRTLAASDGGGSSDGGQGSSQGGGAADGSQQGSDREDLRTTGSQDYTPWLIGAGAIVLLGGAILVVGLVRRKRADKLEE